MLDEVGLYIYIYPQFHITLDMFLNLSQFLNQVGSMIQASRFSMICGDPQLGSEAAKTSACEFGSKSIYNNSASHNFTCVICFYITG